VTKIERTMDGAPSAIVAPFGQRTTLTADAGGSLATVRNPLGQTYLLTHDTHGLLTGATDPAGNVHTFTYDANGRLTKDDEPGPGFTDLQRVELANGGHYVTLTTALGVVSRFQSEPQTGGGELRTITDGAGLASTEERGQDGFDVFTAKEGKVTTVLKGPDARFGMQAPIETQRVVTTPGGRLLIIDTAQTATFSDPANPLSLTAFTETTKVNGKTFTLTFDPVTDTYLDTTPEGVQTRKKVDGAGREIERQYGGFNTTGTVYNPRGQPVVITTGTGPAARVQRLTYNSAGLLFKLTDALNRTDTFSYDAAGRLIGRVRADGGAIVFDRDAAGKLTGFTPPGRAAHTLAYTPAGDLASYTPPGGAATTYTYDAARAPLLTTRGDGATIAFAYDAAGRLQKRTVAAGDTTFTYDPTTGNLASVASPGGQSVAYGYDGERRTSLSWAGPVAGSFERDLDNNLRTTIETVNGADQIVFTYNDDGSLVSVGSPGIGTLILTRSSVHGAVTGTILGGVADARTFDAFGAASGYMAADNGAQFFSATYTFDKLGRVTRRVEAVGAGAAATFDFTYDPAGRLMGVSGAEIQSFTYDANGNRTSGGAVTNAQDQLTALGAATFTYTANGDRATRTDALGTTTYTYDALGNLTAVALPGVPAIDYLYDGQNRRIARNSNGALAKQFLYDNRGRIIAELDGASAVVSRFVYADDRIVPAFMVKGGAVFRLITEPLGSVRLVVKIADGSVAQRLDYDAFGIVTMDTSPGFQPFGFAGGHYDSATGLTHFGARDYDAATGRWTTRDPLLIAGGDSNLYAYAGNDPVNVTDVTGRYTNQELLELEADLALANEAAQEAISQRIDRLKAEGGHKEEIQRLREERSKLKQETTEDRLKRAAEELRKKEEEEKKKKCKKKAPGK
jgi:RHS repeat-associated protein